MTQRQVYPQILVKAEGLAIGHGETVLARNLSLSVGGGSGLLLRGPNGAGKSTLLLTLAGLLPALAGRVALEGSDAEDGPALHHCGHKNAVRPRLSVIETLAFWAALNGTTGLVPQAALERVGLGRMARLDAGYLSAGQQRRLVLARLLVSRRPVWLLDEPSAALDAQGHALLAALVDEHLAAGGLAIIATHDQTGFENLSTLTLDRAA
ncbi:heme ABC exporter ATP-binding protein CcmA [Devosia sp. XJ19-1]|uniref:Heme ABC exporter ATP-binding protein CcmA n=1 Tax=Devosia ureilytica TaxID=2952754 RepID=A0A9Q4AN08_9HYPH|nr:heme ABC exporter ATP-binding protein CcmA [Devosia ureilytica]MCP8882863.1 heme ABC exporter ATP-binding protein CcmA [Devosia ureilytica]MCP8886769.1 heme ABC exporter ATP-binding protein CcmA [Devosia ureilytica]